jgi:hydroxyacylglutathione hydrolase
MIFRRFVAAETGRASYLVGCERVGRAAVIDPQPDVTPALCAAAEASVRITHIFATYARSRLGLTASPASPGAAHGSRRCLVSHAGSEDGEEHDMVRSVTSQHAGTYRRQHLDPRRTERGAPPRPDGRHPLPGGVGRPELAPPTAWLAGQLYQSLFRRLLSLPDPVEVFPALGAADRAGTEPEPRAVTTIGLERRLNPALQCASPKEFARLCSCGMLEPSRETTAGGPDQSRARGQTRRLRRRAARVARAKPSPRGANGPSAGARAGRTTWPSSR